MRPGRGIRKTTAAAIAAAAILALYGVGAAGAAESSDRTMVLAANKTPAKAEDAKAAKPAPVDPAVAALDAATNKAKAGDYLAGQWHPIHFKPAIDKAKDSDCLVCHSEILKAKVRPASEAGVPADKVLAWYQTLDTYAGGQEDFHVRHLTTPFAGKVMNLSCTFCHQGSDPREQSPHVTASPADLTALNGKPTFNLRRSWNPSETCLRCHGQFPWENMALPGPWHEIRADIEPEGTPNGCLTCHETIRTSRHKVTYLKAEGIEAAAQESSDTCYGCHGGRAWYRTSYPYPRTPWEGMDKDVPDWAKSRPTAADARFRLPAAK